jgi:hypothetical protein
VKRENATDTHASFFIRSWDRAVTSRRMRFVHRPVVLLGQSALVFASMLFLIGLCGAVAEWIGGLIVGGYVYDEWFDSRAEWFTRVGAIVLVPFVVAFLTIAVGGRRWLTAVALALLPFAAFYIYFACVDEDFCLFFLPRFGWIMPVASLLLAVVGAALGMGVRRRRDRRAAELRTPE